MAMIEASQDVLILKRASASRSSGKWNDDDFEVLADGVVVGRIFKANAAPVGMAWMWKMLFDYRWPTHGYSRARTSALRRRRGRGLRATVPLSRGAQRRMRHGFSMLLRGYCPK
jgi:hypothetical protein